MTGTRLERLEAVAEAARKLHQGGFEKPPDGISRLMPDEIDLCKALAALSDAQTEGAPSESPAKGEAVERFSYGHWVAMANHEHAGETIADHIRALYAHNDRLLETIKRLETELVDAKYTLHKFIETNTIKVNENLEHSSLLKLVVVELERDRLEAELERLRIGWLPIETAPKDGTSILCYDPKWRDKIAVLYFFTDIWISTPYLVGMTWNPTLWMPAPPAEIKGEEKQ